MLQRKCRATEKLKGMTVVAIHSDRATSDSDSSESISKADIIVVVDKLAMGFDNHYIYLLFNCRNSDNGASIRQFADRANRGGENKPSTRASERA